MPGTVLEQVSKNCIELTCIFLRKEKIWSPPLQLKLRIGDISVFLQMRTKRSKEVSLCARGLSTIIVAFSYGLKSYLLVAANLQS